MKINPVWIFTFLLLNVVFGSAQLPTKSLSNDTTLIKTKLEKAFQVNALGHFKSGNSAFVSPLISSLADSSSSKNQYGNCDETLAPLSVQAAPCNGFSVTSINFIKANRTKESSAVNDNTLNVVYRYANAGTAPDGTLLDALVTVTNYSNNQDATPNTFRDADLYLNPDTNANVGFDNNLQPSLEPETNTLPNAASWSGSITYKIQFVRSGTTTPKTISVAAITLDNDGSTACGGLKESVIYSAATNQTLTSNTTNQVQNGNTFTPSSNAVQSGIGTGIDYASAALFVNVNELSWTYSFATSGTCTAGSASEDRFGSLNMTCQLSFGKNFTTTTLSGNVYNDTNALTDSTVNGTGTNAGGLFANLLSGDDTNGYFVVASVAVNSDGTYTFPTVPKGKSDVVYKVQISTNQGIESSYAPVKRLPTGWTNTGEYLGTAAGNDGPADGLLSVTIGPATTPVTNANFGIEQPPVANNSSLASQANPGGTNNVTVTSTKFTATDPSTGGTVAKLRITAFPSNATSITIGATTYTAATFPAAGVTVTTNAAGNPTQTIAVDPVDGNVTVGIQYVAIDNAGVESSTAATVSVPFGAASISGNVFNDVNGLTDSTVNGFGTNAGGTLYAVLVNGSGNVVQSVLVAAGGAYSFPGVAAGTYTVQLATSGGTVGSAAPAVALPVGWTNTGEKLGTGTGSDNLVNGKLAVTVAASTDVTDANFGIEQRPTANNSALASQTKPSGTTNVTVPATNFTSSDPVTSTVSSIRIIALPSGATSITINGVLYGTGGTAFPAAGVTVPTNAAGNPTQTIAVDPDSTSTSVQIQYVAIDGAGVESSTAATVSVPFGAASISGNVFNDVNGLTDSTVNGFGTNAGGTLYAVLVNGSGNVVQSVLVAAGGAYSFPGVAAGTYTVQLATSGGTVGSAAPAVALPAGWANVGQNGSLEPGNDGTNDGKLTVTLSATGDVTNANFGVEQRPTAGNNMAASRVNPGGTASSTVAAATFTTADTDPGAVSSIRITAMPSNATSITINGVLYGTGGTAFPAAGVTIPVNAAGNPTQTITVDPVNGAVTVVIQYVAIDNAGMENTTAATASVPFTLAPTAAGGEISGRLSFNGQPLRNALIVLSDTENNSRQFVRADANGDYAFTEKTVGRTYIVQPLSSKYSFNSSARAINLIDSAVDTNFEASLKAYHPKNDFDGDGRSDIAVFRPSEGNWYVRRSSDNQMSVFNFGQNGDLPVSADFDGDGKNDYAVFRPSEGNWYIWQSKTQDLRVESFGLSTDKLVPADYDGDGKTDVAVYRGGNWYVRRSSDGAFEAHNYGAENDIPAVGDFDNDGRADLSVYRTSEGNWYTLKSLTGASTSTQFGISTDIPVAGDYDGDGYDDLGQFRNGNWYVLNSTTGFEARQFGSSKDESIVGDYDGDGRADYATYRGGIWSLTYSASNKVKSFSFGLPTDVLVK